MLHSNVQEKHEWFCKLIIIDGSHKNENKDTI